jgi:Bacterial TSP3 repeat
MKPIPKVLRASTAAALLAVAIQPAMAAAIVAAEYYINGDPGPGNGVPITGFNPKAAASLALDIPTATVAALPLGMHVITVRFLDEEGDWSVAFTRNFLREDLATPVASTPLGTTAEYYIDGDPGPGNGTAVTLPAGKWTHGLVIDVPAARIATLTPGFHWITGRIRNANGDWSVAFTRGFLKEDLTADAASALVSHIEYRWFSKGAPVGQPVRLDPEAPASKVSFALLASLQGLVDGGTYQLVATPFDTRGVQGIPVTASVKVETVDSDGDGLPDLWESSNGLNPALAGDGGMDSDGDGLTNLAEFAAKTNPKAADTSGDGINDKLAIDLGLNPLLQYPSIHTTLASLKSGGGATADQVRALYPGRPVLSRNTTTGKFDLRMGLQQSGALSGWQKLSVTPADTRVENGELIFSFTGSEPTGFYRVELGE